MKIITEEDFYRKDELVVTKQEELESLQVLRNIIIPLFVKIWNESKHLDWDPVDITTEDILKKLKKVYRDPKEIRYMFDMTSKKMKRQVIFYVEKHLRYEGHYKLDHPAIRIGYYAAKV